MTRRDNGTVLDSSAASTEARRPDAAAPASPGARPPAGALPPDRLPPAGPSRRAISLIVVAIALLAAAVIVSMATRNRTTVDAVAGDDGWAGAVLEPTRPRPEFTLTDTSGRPFDFAAETEGKLTFLYFGYTNCPDICPIHLSTLNQALRAQPDLSATVVFVTTDPERDTPERIRSWLDGFNGAFIGLTGTPEEILAAEAASGITPAVPDAPGEDGFYLVGHATEILAIGTDDRTYLAYPFGIRQSDWELDLDRIASGEVPPVASAGAVDVIAAVAGQGKAGEAASVYLTLDNRGDDTTIDAVSTDAADQVVLHGTDASGVMTDTSTLDLPSGTTRLEPGGRHIMLEGLRQALEPGDTVTVTLHFADGETAQVAMDVVAYDDVLDRTTPQEAGA